MATLRNQGSSLYSVGNKPPFVEWTVVKGDTAAFQVYVTDDAKLPINIPDWNIDMEIKRPNTTPGVITDDASIILTLVPQQESGDGDGEFTVSLLANQSSLLRTGDIFDIELSDETRVWTVAQGKMIIIEDVTN